MFHGELNLLNAFFAKVKEIETNELIFLSTNEPCSIFLSAITWAGFDKIYYFLVMKIRVTTLKFHMT